MILRYFWDLVFKKFLKIGHFHKKTWKCQKCENREIGRIVVLFKRADLNLPAHQSSDFQSSTTYHYLSSASLISKLPEKYVECKYPFREFYQLVFPKKLLFQLRLKYTNFTKF